MADIAQPLEARTPWRTLALGAAGLVAVLVAAITIWTGLPGLQNFLLVFNSLMIEAAPFVLLGALVSAAIEVFVPPTAFERLARLPAPLQLPAAGLAGLAFPVCECGSVPVARRLAAKGLSPAAAVTFMLAAPILNPIVLISTVVAYRGRDVMVPMVMGRAVLGLVAAMAVGWVIGGRAPGSILKPRPEDEHDHGEDRTRSARFFGHLAGDFSFMARFLVLGAAVAAAMQTFVPQSVLGAIANTPIVNLAAMMALAFVLSLCSESDAFVAASFVQFGPASQLAFLVFGPMVDTKLGFLYSATFTRGFFRTVVVIVAGVTLVGTLWLEVLLG
jgi:uncharacterized membrane protein YraQ (UPF0718 family)